jgi:hypothetical protein
MLSHEEAIEFVRPVLKQLITIFLKLVDDIDYDELIEALRTIVEVFEDEIAPYAIELCTKLGEAFIRMFEAAREGSGGGMELEVDAESSLTACGLMSAIRRILESISGRFPELWPQLEVILEEPILTCLRDPNQQSTEDGLHCLAELTHNQTTISPRMWHFFPEIVNSILNDKGILDDFLPQCFVPLCNFMKHDPHQFKNGTNQIVGLPIDMTCCLAKKAFELARLKEDEIEAMCAISLLNAVLENVEGCDENYLPGIVECFFKEIPEAECPDYKIMLT